MNTGAVIEKLHWNVRTRCNLPCSFCYLWRRPFVEELSTVEAIDLIRQIAQLAKWIVFGGGDPLMRPDLLELVSIARSLGLRVDLQTNADLIRQVDAESLLSNLDRFGLSLDGESSEIHDAARSAPGNFDRTFTALQLAERIGLRTTIRTTVTAANVGRIRGLGHLISRYACIDKWSIRQFSPLGRGERNRTQHEITDSVFQAEVASIRRDYRAVLRIGVVTRDDLEGCYCLVAPDGTLYGHPLKGEGYRAVGKFPDERLVDLIGRLPYSPAARKRRANEASVDD